jgi:RNA recognition motif-containing protein
VASAYLYTVGKARFALLQVTDEVAAESAIEALNGSELFGRELIVNWATKQRPVRVKVRLSI